MFSNGLIQRVVTSISLKQGVSFPSKRVWASALHQLERCFHGAYVVQPLSIDSFQKDNFYNHMTLDHCVQSKLPSNISKSRHYYSLTCVQQRSAVHRHSQVRNKSKKKVFDSDADSDDDLDDFDGAIDADDLEAPEKFKKMKFAVSSLRADSVTSNALNIARNRLDEMFLSSSLLMNGERMQKKAEKMQEGDYVDVITEKLEDKIKVKRVKLLKTSSEKTKTGKYNVLVRVWKAPFVIDPPNRI